MEPQQYISMASVALAALMALFGGFRFITAQVEGIRREIIAAEDKARLLVEKASESESKQRQTAHSAVQALCTSLQVDIRTLQREAVTHEQMGALEARILHSMNKIEVKVDRLAETAGEIVAIKQSMHSIDARLERMDARMHARSNGPKESNS